MIAHDTGNPLGTKMLQHGDGRNIADGTTQELDFGGTMLAQQGEPALKGGKMAVGVDTSPSIAQSRRMSLVGASQFIPLAI